MNNIAVTFADSVFSQGNSVLVQNNKAQNIGVLFKDPAVLSYSDINFMELLENDGAVKEIIASLENDIFAGEIGGILPITATGIPAGFTGIQATKIDDTHAKIELLGKATNHESKDNVMNMTFAFGNNAFGSKVATSVLNSSKTSVGVSYKDVNPAIYNRELAFDKKELFETFANDGAIEGQITVTLTGDTFTGTNGAQLPVTVTNIPASLTTIATRIDDTHATLKFTGKARLHDVINSVTDMRIIFNDSAFTLKEASKVKNNSIDNSFSVIFREFPSLKYSSLGFNELASNNGKVNTITAVLTNDKFKGEVGSKLLIKATNLPIGFTGIEAVKIDDTHAVISLLGSAKLHKAKNSITNLGISFDPTAFESGLTTVANATKSGLSINFVDSFGAYNPAKPNDFIINDTTLDGISQYKPSITGLSNGNFVVTWFDSQKNIEGAIFDAKGSRLTSQDFKIDVDTTEDINNPQELPKITELKNGSFVVVWQNQEVTSNQTTLNGSLFNFDGSRVPVNFQNEFKISNSTLGNQLNPSIAGLRDGNFVVTWEDSRNGSKEIYASVFKYDGTPLQSADLLFTQNSTSTGDKLKPSVTALSDTNFVVTWQSNNHFYGMVYTKEGQATLKQPFQLDSQSSVNASNLVVKALNNDTFVASWTDERNGSKDIFAGIFYNVDGTPMNVGQSTGGTDLYSFKVDSATTGDQILPQITALEGDRFAITWQDQRNQNSDIYGAVFYPNGSRIKVDDQDDFRIDLDTTSGNQINPTITSLTNGNIAIAWEDQRNSNESDIYGRLINANSLVKPSLEFDIMTLNEAIKNDGSIEGSIKVKLNGDIFVGDVNAVLPITVTNVPAGLTVISKKIDDTHAVITFTGNARSHRAIDSLNDIRITYNDDAFGGQSGAVVKNNSPLNNFGLLFMNSASLEYDVLSFIETPENKGAVNPIIATLTSDKFAGAIGSILPIAATSIPAGFTGIQAIKIDDTHAKISLLGNATLHQATNSTNNLAFNFGDKAFLSGKATGVVNAVKTGVQVSFLDNQRRINFNTTTLLESTANNGSIGTIVNVTLENDIFVGAINATLPITVKNLPAGLTGTATKIDDTHASIKITGNASKHDPINNVKDVNIVFGDKAFSQANSSTVANNNNKLFFGVEFKATPSLIYTNAGIFNETSTNDGAVSEIIAELSNDTFAGAVGSSLGITSPKLPTGFTGISAIKVDDTHAKITLLGKATQHQATDSINNLAFTLAKTAFTSGTSPLGSSKTDAGVVFNDNPRSIRMSSFTLNESVLNNGSIDGYIGVTLEGDKFTGAVNSKLGITATNVPAGLTVVATKIDDTHAKITYTGTATKHEAVNSVTNINIVFTDTAFTQKSASKVAGNTAKQGFGLNFLNSPRLSYSNLGFNENENNDGSINSLTVTLENDTFAGAVGAELPITGTNVPAGLTLKAIREDEKTATIRLIGNAQKHLASNSINNLNIAFGDKAFTSGKALNVVNSTKVLAVTFKDNQRVLSFDKTSVKEAILNDGSIGEFITVELSGDVFTGTVGSTLGFSAKNLPAGLTAVATKLDNTHAKITFGGKATKHTTLNDVHNLSLIFADTAFGQQQATSVTNNSSAQVFDILFKDANTTSSNTDISLTYSRSKFNEEVLNDGSIVPISVTITNGTFAGNIGSTLEVSSSSNLPAGLQLVATKVSNVEAKLALVGNALDHQTTNNINQFEVQFANSAFTNNNASLVLNSKKTIPINFLNNVRTLSFDRTALSEALENNGSIDGGIYITLKDDVFTGTIGSTLALTAQNVPTGLTPIVTKLSDTTAKLTFTGAATNHSAKDSLNNIKVMLSNDSFKQGNASGVSNNAQNFGISFKDSPKLTYSAQNFTEASVNDGSIMPITVTLSNDMFAGEVGSALAITGTNLPQGLTLQATKVSDTVAMVQLLGNAKLHQNIHNVNNFAISFGNNAFRSGNASSVVSASKELPIIYTNNLDRGLKFDKTTLNEFAVNNGQIDGYITVTLVGDTFVGTSGSTLAITPQNVPAGLTAIATKLDDTHAKIVFNGTATNHTAKDSVNNVSIVFGDSAFSQATASNVVNNSTSQKLGVNFKDQAKLTYSAEQFNESKLNNGAIDEITVTLENDTFAGVIGSTLSLSSSTVPNGLTLSAIKTGSNKAVLRLSGNAKLHQSANNISDFSVTFANSAFTSGTASSIQNTTKTLPILFLDNKDRALTFDRSTLSEALSNNGTLDGVINVTLNNEIFTGEDDSVLAITTENVPAGLSVVATKIDDTHAQIMVNGVAQQHKAINSISNMSVVFADSDFQQGNASNVLQNNTSKKFGLTFIDQSPSNFYGLAFEKVTYAFDETDATHDVMIRVNLSQPALVNLSFKVTTESINANYGDYIPINKVFTINKGNTYIDIPVTIIGDTIKEILNKSFNLRISEPSLSNVQITNQTAIITINDGNDTGTVTSKTGSARADYMAGDDRADSITGYAFDSKNKPIQPDLNDTLFGYGGDDRIFGGTDDDSIDGGTGNDILDGSDGNDRIIGDTGNDIISGGNGNDNIDAGTGNNLVSGDDGNDYIFVGYGSSTINGGLGNDYIVDNTDYNIYTNAGNKLITENEGNDTIYLGNGNDTINSGLGNDYIDGGSGNNLINDTDGVSNISAGGGNDTISTASSNDAINAGDGNNLINAGDGDNSVYTGSGADTITTGIGNDTINSGNGNDLISSDLGNDIIRAGEGADTIIAGAGTNTVYGGNHNDIFILKRGDSIATAINSLWLQDGDRIDISDYKLPTIADTVINDQGTIRIDYAKNQLWIDSDVINLGAVVTKNHSFKVVIESGKKFLQVYNPVTNIIQGTTENDWIEGSNSTVIASNNLSETIIGALGNDTIFGYGGNDLINGNDGNDSIDGGDGDNQLFGDDGDDTISAGYGNNTVTGGLGNDRINIAGGNNLITENEGDDSISLGSGNDTVNSNLGNDSIALGSGSNIVTDLVGNNNIYALSGNDTITTGVGNDTISAGDGNNNIVAGEGNNYIYANSANDTVSAGSGNDVISVANGANYVESGAGNDTISAYEVYYDSTNKISYNLGGNNTIIAGLGDDSIITGQGSDSIDGGLGNDFIIAGAGADTIIGGVGIDTLDGGDGADTFVLKRGDAPTTQTPDKLVVQSGDRLDISDYSLVVTNGSEITKATTSTSNIYLDTTRSQLVIKHQQGEDRYQVSETDVLNYIFTINQTSVSTFVVLSATDTMYGTNGDDVLTGTDRNETFFGRDGNDTISGLAGNDSIDGGLGNDSLLGGTGNNTLDGGLGNDFISGDTGDDLITGGLGNDTISAGNGLNIITDTDGIANITAGNGNDSITTGSSADQINAGDGNNSIIAGAGANNITTGSGSDTITSGDNADTINAGSGNNIISAGLGNNFITVGSGNSSIEVGAGNDSIYAGIGQDTINAGDGNNNITVGSYNSTTRIYDGGNSILNTGSGIDIILSGSGADTITSGAGNDSIKAGTGIDIIYAGLGQDTINGEDGADILVYLKGDSLDLASDFVYIQSGDRFDITDYATNMANNAILDTNAGSAVYLDAMTDQIKIKYTVDSVEKLDAITISTALSNYKWVIQIDATNNKTYILVDSIIQAPTMQKQPTLSLDVQSVNTASSELTGQSIELNLNPLQFGISTMSSSVNSLTGNNDSILKSFEKNTLAS